jgi:hypothetical protein
MVLLCNARQVEGLFAPNVPWLGNHFGLTRWYSLVMWVKWKLILVCLEVVLISTQDRCMVYTKCTIDSEIILGATNGPPMWRTQDRCTVCAKHTTTSLIILDTPDCTPRRVDQAEAVFDLFREGFNFSARKVHGLCRKYHVHGNFFRHTRWYL